MRLTKALVISDREQLSYLRSLDLNNKIKSIHHHLHHHTSKNKIKFFKLNPLPEKLDVKIISQNPNRNIHKVLK